MTVQALEQGRAAATVVAVGQVLGFAALTAIGARITVELPGIPAPLTLQVLAVLLAGLTLGWRRGTASQIAYVAAIACGIPVDARMHGVAALVGPSGGYLLGFVLAAAVCGAVAGQSHSLVRLVTATLVGLAALYLCGGAWLALYAGGDLATVWRLAIAPFVAVDLLKAAIAALSIRGLKAASHSGRPTPPRGTGPGRGT